ncbi:MAG TPA: RNA 3'-terminal phosphate cyclase [Gallionellaceae bacterium]
METILIDGSQGEGGGQILRSALTLSMITGTPFRIERIRAGRAKPGLLRQHLTAAAAAAEICDARVSGNTAGSTTLEFVPGAIKGGAYRFDIGTAGSCTLVLQTVLPALWFAGRASTVTVSGGTHNSGAPPADFLVRAWLPLMQRMGVDMEISLLRHGFYPAGGGEVQATIRPVAALQPLHLCTRGELIATKAIAVVAGLPADIAKRELEHLGGHFAQAEQEMRVLSSREGPGNVVMIELRHAGLTEVFSAPGEKGVKAETVADRAAQEALRYLESGAFAGEHLADQLVLPMALAGSGSFTTSTVSPHLETNWQVIQKFLPVDFEVTQRGAVHQVTVVS